MPLPTFCKLPTCLPEGGPLVLPHLMVTIDRTQRRFEGRSVLKPDLDLSAYRFKAVFDWVEFEVHLGKTTQVQHVQSILRRYLSRDSHICPAELGSGNTFTSCSIKIQDPPNLAIVAEIHQDLFDTYGETKPSQVTAIEVSVDAYPRAPSDEARAHLLGAMQRTIWTGRDIWSDPKSRLRTAFRRGENGGVMLVPRPEEVGTKLCPSNPDNHKAPFINGTMYLGPKEGAFMLRVMDKVKDKQRPDGSFEDLPDDRRRARIEVTLRGHELLNLGIMDVPSLRRVNVSSFKKRYFQFKLPAFQVTSPIRSVADGVQNFREGRRAQAYLTSGVIGLMAMDRAISQCRRRDRPTHLTALKKQARNMGLTLHPSRRKPRLAPALVSWVEMNRRVDVAFRELEARERTAWKRRSSEVLLMMGREVSA